MLPGFHPWSSLQVLSTLPLNRVEFTQITSYPLVLFKSTVSLSVFSSGCLSIIECGVLKSPLFNVLL